MKHFKTAIALVLGLVVMLQAGVAFSASDPQVYAGEQLRTLGILSGYEDGSLKLDNPINRAEMATIMVRTLGYAEKEIASQGVPFTDVKDGFWAFSNIEKAAALSLISGYPGGEFKPTNNITFAEMSAIYLRAIGAEVNPEEAWPTNYMNLGKQKGLITDEDIDPNHVVTRGEVSDYLWRLLLIKH